MFAQMLDLRLQFETIRDLRGEIVRNIAETKRRLLDVETRQCETVREVTVLSVVHFAIVLTVEMFSNSYCLLLKAKLLNKLQ